MSDRTVRDETSNAAPPDAAANSTHPGSLTEASADHLNSQALTIERSLVQQLDEVIAGRVKGGIPAAANYRILHKLGEGTYGTVWLAEDRSGVRAAIKFFAHGTGQQWQSLQDEVQSLARLETTFGIIALKEVAPDANPPYFVMSYAEGGSLQQLVERGPVPASEALRLFSDITRALAFVHAKGIRHCDLKPGNILLNQHGQPLIADFGQAHLSDDAAPALGTFFYMAPEQAAAGAQIPDTRWDVYGLGAIIYALLTGAPPRKDTGLSDELRKTEKLHHRLKIYRERIQSLPLPTKHHEVPGVDAMLARIIDRCLTLDPDKRLRDAGAILDALAVRRRQIRQRPMLLFGVLAPLLVLVLMIGGGSLAATHAVEKARAGLTAQLLDSDLVTARLAARVLEEKLKDGVVMIEDFSAAGSEPRLPKLVEPIVAKRKAQQQLTADDLKPVYEWLGKRSTWRTCRDYFRTLTIVDANGDVIARVDTGETAHVPSPADQLSYLKQNYAWRDWFHGQGDQHARKSERFTSIRETHISHPYLGEQLNRGHKLVNISVPIKGPDGATLGVIVGHIDWDRLQGWLGELRSWMGEVRASGGFPVVVNDRGQCLTHRDPNLIELKVGEIPPAYYDASWVKNVTAGSNADFTDPVTRQSQLAGYAAAKPCEKTGQQWVVLIEHDTAAVLRPVNALKDRLTNIGIGVVATMVFMIGGLWGWLVWTLRREERLAAE